MKTPEQRGPIGNWTRERRLAKGMSPEQVVDQLVRFGVHIKASSYRGVESGARRPGGEALAALEQLWGSEAPKPEVVSTGDLVAALQAQTAVISELVEALRQMTVERPATDEATVRAMVEALLRVARPGDEPQLPLADMQP